MRGGSYRSDAADLRSAARDHTRTDDWMITDPQSPKSIWWYSDCTDVGFRVVANSTGETRRPASDDYSALSPGRGCRAAAFSSAAA